MLPPSDVGCPATGFTRSCREVLAQWTCPKYVHIIGTDPQTGQSVDKYGCKDSFEHMLSIENTQQVRQTGAAIESFRNEVVKANEASDAERQRLIDSAARLGLLPR